MTTDGRNRNRFRRLLSLAGWALVWERLWPRLWPPLAVVLVFLSVALFDLLPALPVWLHATVLLGFAGAALAALGPAFAALKPVDHALARQRLERDSGLTHRPLATLEDRLAAGGDDPAARMLWQRHLQRIEPAVDALAVRPPSPGMARREPWGIRAGLLLLLVIALVVAGGDRERRLVRALTPERAGGAVVAPMAELWVTPPAYTRAAPLFLTGPGAAGDAGGGPGAPAAGADAVEALSVPEGSTVLARASGITAPPLLVVGNDEIAFAAIDDGRRPSAFRAEHTIAAGDRLAVYSRGRSLAAWPLSVVPDSAPRIVFAQPPVERNDVYLAFAYEATDDYGVSSVTAVLGRAGSDEEALRLPLPLAAADQPSAVGSELCDLTAHPWAGQRVLVHLAAADARGQVGVSEAVEVVLPERSFADPVAKAVIAERKRLTNASPQVQAAVAAALAALAAKPQAFGDDIVISLALAVAKSRLLHDRGADAVPSVQDILWETALRLEQGGVPFAERLLQAAREALAQALQRDAPDAEIEQLIDALQQALDQYLAAVAAELARQGGELMPPDAAVRVLRSDDLQQLLETARQLARTGARDGARAALAELQRMLDGIRAGLQAAPDREAQAEAQALMRDLRELAERQQALMEQTFRRQREMRTARRSDRGQPPTAGTAEQQQLRTALGTLSMRLAGVLGDVPLPLAKADRGMKSAVDALQAGRPADALPGQGAAVDALSSALDQVGQSLAQRLGGLVGMSGQSGGSRGGDIFGRSPANGMRGYGTGEVAIPDEMQARRAQEVLRELRRRASERQRPQGELDYIERLLRRF
jgi:uncharacterized protein (TIGR02302 family)